jgi:molybdopterin-containing oxidoreductase family iron-sulfur binding subunit
VRATLPADPDVADPKTGKTATAGTANEPRLAPGNRLFAIESTPTLVGAMADHKLRVRPELVHQFAVDLYNAVAGGGNAGGGTTAPATGAAAPTAAAGAKAPWFAKLVEELQAHKGKSLVVAGEYAPVEIHLLAHAINAALGNISAAAGDGKPVALIPVVEATPADSVKSLTELRDAMAAGRWTCC